MTSSRSFENAARLLHPSGRHLPLDGGILADIAAGLGTTIPPMAPPQDGIDRVRLLTTERYDVWMHAWAPGAVAPDHDHDGSISVVHVMLGRLKETVSDQPGSPAALRVLDEGTTTGLDVLPSHALANDSGGPAVSIHVYSPPLTDDPDPT